MAFRATTGKWGSHFFLQRSIWLFLAKLFPTLTFLVITILYARQLSYVEYGVFQSVWMLVNVSVVVLGFGVYSVLLSSGTNSVQKVFKENLLKGGFFYVLLFLIIGIIVFSTLSRQSVSLSILVLSLILIHAVSFIAESVLIKKQKETFIFAINLLYSLLYLGWHVYHFRSGYNIVYLVLGVALLGVLRLGVSTILATKSTAVLDSLPLSTKHWFFIGFNEVIGVVSKWLDKLVLVYFLTPAAFAIFFNGSIEIPFFGLLISVIGSILLVEVSRYLTDKEKVVQTFRDTFLLLSNIVFPLFWFLYFFKQEIFSVIFNDRYAASVGIFSMMILIIPVRITHYTAILQCYNKAHLILRGSIIDILLALALMPLLNMAMGLQGIALAIVLATYIQSFFYLYHSARVLQTKVFSLVPWATLLFRFILIFVLVGLFRYFVESTGDLYTLIFAITFTGLIIGFCLYFYFSKVKAQENRL